MNKYQILAGIFILFLFVNIILSVPVRSCKDIVAVGHTTAGDYNLFLKVRDPSRPGLQVLCLVPEGYEYTYHHPWTGKPMDFTVKHKFIGVATKGDTIPDIVKAGRLATTVRKRFTIAIPDLEADDIRYLIFKWFKA